MFKKTEDYEKAASQLQPVRSGIPVWVLATSAIVLFNIPVLVFIAFGSINYCESDYLAPADECVKWLKLRDWAFWKWLDRPGVLETIGWVFVCAAMTYLAKACWDIWRESKRAS